MTPSPPDAALELRGVVKTFRTTRAVDGLDLSVPAGSIHAILGPNGAGKTTTVSMIATLTVPDSGEVRVGGVDAVRHPGRVRERIGLSGQYAAVDGTLTGLENLRMVGQLYGLSRRVASARAREMIADLDLSAAADRPMNTYSGGMRRRLDLAGALINRPELVILDEPTTGLDPRARRQIWGLVTDLARSGTTILLTTQYLEEADELADEITVIDHGRVIARGTAESLKADHGRTVLTVTVPEHAEEYLVRAALAEVGVGEPRRDGAVWTVGVADGTRSSAAAVAALTRIDVDVVDAVVSVPTLDSVFLSLTTAQESTDAH